MKTSIATVSIGGDLREKLAAIAAAGFDGVEIFETDFLAFDGSPRDVRRMIADHGLTTTLFQPFRDFEGLPEPQRARAFERAERKFDLMGELGAELMLVCSSVSPAALGGIDRLAADFHALGERAAARGLRVGYEALAWGRHINDHRDAWEVVRRAEHAHVGLILDSFHTLSRGIEVESIRSIPGDRIFIVQLADAPLLNMDVLQWSRHFRCMPGQGDLPIADFMRAVLATGYSGPLSLEIFNDQFRGGSPGSIAVDGHRSLVNLMDGLRETAPELAASLPDLPPRIGVQGVEFIEFAASAAERGELEAQFAALGFAPHAHHRSKDVVVWRQPGGAGGPNLVINSEEEGLAYSAYLTHGTNAYAIGLRVEDAAATVQRARALGAEVFEQRRGPGELAIPAIRGMGGGLLYFIDETLADVWEVEFTSLPASRMLAGMLTGIDHIAQTMNYEEMLTWALFYTSIFRARKLPMVDVVDPAGLVRSQVIESEEEGVRLTLNGSDNHRTLAGHFITESFGSSVQHIAFACADIFAASEALTARGFIRLGIPANYYDDLDARFELEPALLERLRAANILYDRDGAGAEFFQIYSAAMPDGRFFEVVERRGGYAGYGAANAVFRIAAQKRQVRPATMPRL
ncbi:bifunctional sugar phosphate isomerase/epimerase/4-hydroxyphenylpyruvate dioxygenase family protein [Devosia sp.]|uniref:bifunctional sugar phosphate isomerase/epimerase/4-hydroxyphenylpyruvate dioxygenase family protein n=1 Tax=Devosia sp. TaxID=1871048 RepID=UPI002B000983|nr:TIM barrel protein [Devosia sp.]